jgi:ATP-dependent Lon protease
MFSHGYGFVVDYLAEILRSMRNHDYSDAYKDFFSISTDISTRDRDAIHKTFSGLMKVIYPHNEATKEEIEELLTLAIEGRKRVKDQLLRIDSTYPKVSFSYQDKLGKTYQVKTLEEKEYPTYYYQQYQEEAQKENIIVEEDSELKENHLTFSENQKGISFDSLIIPYLKKAKNITLTDPYLRIFYQIKNLMELLESIIKVKSKEQEINFHLLTTLDEFRGEQQVEYFEQIEKSCAIAGLNFTWEFDGTNSIHARSIITDTGWKIILDRGLDIFQHYDISNTFSLANRLQEFRNCKAFEITYVTFYHNEEIGRKTK